MSRFGAVPRLGTLLYRFGWNDEHRLRLELFLRSARQNLKIRDWKVILIFY